MTHETNAPVFFSPQFLKGSLRHPQGSESYTDFFLPLAAAVYYGPGYDYAQRQEGVPAGTWLRVLGSENGFALCDYQSGSQWVRAYFPGI